jgi:ATPase family protein associated with various cellular activities (AAA)/winged helix domain-containing protein
MTNLDARLEHATDEQAVAPDVPSPDLSFNRTSAGPREALAASLLRLDEAIEAAIAQFEHSLPSDVASDLSRTEYITREDTARLLSLAPCEGNWSIPATGAGEPKFAVPIEGSRLTELQAHFGLTAPELDALLVAASVDLDPRYERLFAYLQDDLTRRRPTIGTLGRLAGTAAEREWEALAWLAADAPLVRGRLVCIVDDASHPSALCSRQVFANEIVVRYLADVDERSQTAASCCTLHAPTAAAQVGHAWLRHPELAAFATAVLDSGGMLSIGLVGPHPGERTQLAEAVAASHGLFLLVIDARRLMTDAVADRLEDALLLARLRGAVAYVDGLDLLVAHEQMQLRAHLVEALARHAVHFIVSSSAAWPTGEPNPPMLVNVRVRMPDATERESLWQSSLARCGAAANQPDVAYVARVFALSETQIGTAARTCVPVHGAAKDAAIPRLVLSASARGQLSLNLPRAVVRIEPTALWEDLVLPADVSAQLREICLHATHQYTVFEQWGFARRSSRGTGLTVLFSGGPGTGKTTACEVIAAALGRTLLKIDLSQVVSKYIGDTEKQLDEVFTIAEQAAAVLLFDEADTLFGKRTQISDAHDRYANVEVGYLLQKIEEYTGIAVLATNLHANIDPAFARRLRFTVEFPFPDEQSRVDIWRVSIPGGVPVADDVAFDVLARRFPVAGGSIRNIAVAAAILAAADGLPISLAHLDHAARREYQKLGKMPPQASFFGQVAVS